MSDRRDPDADTRAELLAQIRAADAALGQRAPRRDDDRPRLVFADWLEQRGDYARAMLIRLQCELAHLPAHERRAVELGWEIEHLIAAHGAAWIAELPALRGVQWTRFARGFIAAARVRDVSALRDHAAAIAAAAPVTSVEIEHLVESRPPLELPWLRELVVHAAEPTDPSLERSILSQARAVEIARAVEEVDIDWLARRDPRAPLERFAIRGDHTGARRALDQLRAMPGCRALRDLDLGTQFADRDTGYFDDPTLKLDGAGILADLELRALERLDISRQRVTSVGVGAILRSVPRLRELRARANEIDTLDFLGADFGDPLVSLDLGDNQLDRAAILALLGSARTATLEVLRLDTCELNANAAAALARAPFWSTLRVLDLSNNPIGTYGLLALAEAPPPPHLHTLRLANVDLDGDAPALLASIEWLRELVALDLGANDLSGAAPLWRELASGQLRDLGAAYAKLTPASCAELAPIAERAVRLDLGGNHGIGGGLAAWTCAPALQRLGLADCKLGGRELAWLADGDGPSPLARLSLAHNPIAHAALGELLDSRLARGLAELDLTGCAAGAPLLRVLGRARLPLLRTLLLYDTRFEPAELQQLARMPSVAGADIGVAAERVWEYPADVRAELQQRFGATWSWRREHAVEI